MKNIVFNNGKELKVTEEIANIIHKRILEGCNNWQCFEHDEGLDIIVNLNQVSYIY